MGLTIPAIEIQPPTAIHLRTAWFWVGVAPSPSFPICIRRTRIPTVARIDVV